MTPFRSSCFLVAALLSVWSTGCGKANISDYTRPGGGLQRAPAVDAEPRGANQTPNLEQPALNLSELRDTGFDTGLTACVKEGLATKGSSAFAPRVIRATTAFLSGKSLETNDEFFQLYDILLREIVTPADGLVAYSRLRDGGDLRSLWLKVREHLPRLDLNALDTDNKRIAFWVNLYNIVMIDILVDDPSALSKLGETFGQTKRNIGGFDITLNTIEYGILQLGELQVDNPVPTSAWPSYSEKRLHVALVCGAISCPKLRNFAYEADSLETILEENAHMFFNDGAKHFVRTEAGSYRVSELFRWFAKDFDAFGGIAAPKDLGRYLLSTCRSDTAEASEFLSGIESFTTLSRGGVVTYDWSPNEL
jgi:hypothetical protein